MKCSSHTHKKAREVNQPICVVLARPMDQTDPCLLRIDGVNMLVATLRELKQRELFSHILVSIPQTVPESLLGPLKAEGITVVTSQYEEPQRRLLECMENHKAEVATVLTAYSLFIDIESLTQSLDLVRRGEADAVYAQDVIAPKFFMIINRCGAKKLASNLPRPVSPFAFPGKLEQLADNDLRPPTPCTDIEGAGERFLWELLFAGERCAIPADVLKRFMVVTPVKERLNKASYLRFITSEYGISDASSLEKPLETMEPWDSSLRLGMHINYAGALAEHFPENRGAALEIGHGKTGITAQLVGIAFDQTFGVDLLKHSEDGIDAARKFLSALSTQKAGLLPVEGMPDATPSFLNCRLEEAEMESHSIDFCFSRMVLEHVDNIPTMSQELARVMKPGGVMIHEIGLQDHQDLSHIHFEFLKHSPEAWAKMHKGTNLLRINDFVDLWESMGFACEIIKRDMRIVRPDSIHSCWDGYSDEDLYCYRAVIKSIKR